MSLYTFCMPIFSLIYVTAQIEKGGDCKKTSVFDENLFLLIDIKINHDTDDLVTGTLFLLHSNIHA